MTDKNIQISFLPQDTEMIKSFLQEKNYYNIVTYSKGLDSIYIDMSKEKGCETLCYDIADIILTLIKERNLKEYIWKTYTNINEDDKKSVYTEAINLFNRKENFIKDTIYSKLDEFIMDNNDLNLEGFLKFRMKDFISYISILSDIALEEHGLPCFIG